MAVVVIDPEDLVSMVRAAVRAELDAHASASADARAEWLGASGAARILGVHPRTVTSLASRHEIRASRVGKLWRFQRADVDAFLAERASGVCARPGTDTEPATTSSRVHQLRAVKP